MKRTDRQHWDAATAGWDSPPYRSQTLVGLGVPPSRDVGALSVKRTDEARQQIDRLAPPGTMVSPDYESEFGPHPYRW